MKKNRTKKEKGNAVDFRHTIKKGKKKTLGKKS
jgi:hypothetical protein